MNDEKVFVQVDKTVVKITGLSIKGLNIQQVENILREKLKSMARVIGVTGSSLEMDIYGIEEDAILRDSEGLVKAIAFADGITLTDLARISSVKKIQEVPVGQIPDYDPEQCAKERWL